MQLQLHLLRRIYPQKLAMPATPQVGFPLPLVSTPFRPLRKLNPNVRTQPSIPHHPSKAVLRLHPLLSQLFPSPQPMKHLSQVHSTLHVTAHQYLPSSHPLSHHNHHPSIAPPQPWECSTSVHNAVHWMFVAQRYLEILVVMRLIDLIERVVNERVK